MLQSASATTRKILATLLFAVVLGLGSATVFVPSVSADRYYCDHGETRDAYGAIIYQFQTHWQEWGWHWNESDQAYEYIPKHVHQVEHRVYDQFWWWQYSAHTFNLYCP